MSGGRLLLFSTRPDPPEQNQLNCNRIHKSFGRRLPKGLRGEARRSFHLAGCATQEVYVRAYSANLFLEFGQQPIMGIVAPSSMPHNYVELCRFAPAQQLGKQRTR